MTRFRGWLDIQVIERLRRNGLTFARDGLIVAACYVLGDYLRLFPDSLQQEDVRPLLAVLPSIIAIYLVSEYCFRIHRQFWQYASLPDVAALADAVLAATVVVAILDLFMYALSLSTSQKRLIPLAVILIGGALSLLFLISVRMWPVLIPNRQRPHVGWSRVLIVGAGQGGDHIARDLLTNPQRHQEPVGFVDDDPLKRRRRIHNLPVLGSVDGLVDLVTLERIDIIGIAIPSASAAELERILRLAQETNARIQVLPPTGEMTESETPLQFRDINLNDLLIRSPSTNLASAGILSVTIKGQVILVTGAAGSIGSELCRQLATFELKMLIAVDNNESGLFDLGKDLAKVCDPARFILVLGDVTDVNKLASIFNKFRPSMVFHAAAFKHVPMLEDFPEEALSVNVQGTLNMCQLAAESGCARFVFVSTDKAVHPVNALGYSKRLGELVARVHDGFGCVFCSVRFGNVVGSRGSALPEFVRQIDAGGPVRVTHPDVERYFMTIAEAANLVIEAGTIAKGGEIFMLDMGDPVKIAELAKRIIRMRGLRVGPDIEIVFTGLRPGEKLTEDLLFQGERIRPTQNPSIVAVDEHSRTDMDKDQLQAQVDELHLIAANGDPDALRAALRQAANGASQSAPTGS